MTEREAQRARLLYHYERATPDERRAGAAWYPTIAARAANIDPTRAADEMLSALAILSPRVRVSQNLRDLETLTRYHGAGPVQAFPVNAVKAQRLLNGEPFDSIVGPSPKVRAFRANLLGDTEAVTVDTWMRAVMDGLDLNQGGAANGERGHAPSMTVKQYERRAQVIRDLAHELGIEPRTLQATVWVAARRKEF